MGSFRSIWACALVALGAQAHAQTTSPAGSSPSDAGAGVTQGAPIGSGLVAPNAAAPQPNPNLTTNFALPAKRGFYRTEPVFVYPFLGLGAGHNSNITGVNANPVGSAFMVLSPRVYADVKERGNTHSLAYNGNYGRYFDSSADNFNEHELIARTLNQFSSRSDLDASAYYLIKQDGRGSVNRPFSAEPDRWQAAGALAMFGYGARNAPGRLEFDVVLTDKHYQNNRGITEFFDVATVGLGGKFYYRLAPRTRAVGEVRFTQYDYKSSQSLLDNYEMRYLAGVTWDATAATSGTIKAGWMTKHFKAGATADIAGPTLDAAVRWSPRSYSVFDFVVQRSAVESTGTGVATVNTSLGTIWTHRWKEFISTRALLSHINSDFRGLSRTDRLTTMSVGGYFDVRTWLRLGAEYTHQRRGSTDNNVEFSCDVLLFTVGATL